MRALAWGTLVALLLVGCGDDMMDDDAGTDGSAADSGPAAICGNEDVELGEVCDDGNTEGGDGCNRDCTSDESCGNGISELAEVCDDGNTTNGDGCSAGCDSDESCGNGLADFGVGEVCDDGNTADGDGCSADCTSVESCGNGIVDAGEECDDGNDATGDGCDASCMEESCTTAAECDDGNPCNGDETCGGDGICAAGTPIAEGGTCGDAPTRDICLANTCATSACGDGFTDDGATPAETCDDGGTSAGDGCDASCLLEACTVAGDCDDMNPCTSGHSCDAATCTLGVAISDGTRCDADGSPATTDICLMGRCALSACGDGYVDIGEQCDDGNTRSGDGCEMDCSLPTVPITAFRVTALELLDPHFYTVLGTACNDITPTVNTLIESVLDDYSLNAAGLFQPLNLAVATNPVEIAFGAFCMPGTPRDACMPSPTATVIATTATNTLPAAMACLTADTAVLNPSYTGVVNTPSGPCFVTAEQTFSVNLGAVVINLASSRMAGTYAGGASPSRVVNGVIVGFLSEAEARVATFDPTIPIVGGDTIYSHLADGGAPGSACEGVSGFTTDDSDTLAGDNGFYFYLNFEAERVDWTP